MVDSSYYWKLWDSLTFDELLSMRKSNRFSRDLEHSYKTYKMGRIIRELIPMIAIVGIANVVLSQVLKKAKEDKI